MSDWRDTLFAVAVLPETAPLLLASAPAWLWSRDFSRTLWANAAGGRRLGAANLAALTSLDWPVGHPLRRDLENAGRVLGDGAMLARLRFPGLDAVPRPCRMRRLRLPSGVRAVLVEALAAEPGSMSEAAALRFYSDGGACAVLLDAEGAVVAPPQFSGLRPPVAAGSQARIERPDGPSRLALVEDPHTVARTESDGEGAEAVVPEGSPTAMPAAAPMAGDIAAVPVEPEPDAVAAEPAPDTLPAAGEAAEEAPQASAATRAGPVPDWLLSRLALYRVEAAATPGPAAPVDAAPSPRQLAETDAVSETETAPADAVPAAAAPQGTPPDTGEAARPTVPEPASEPSEAAVPAADDPAAFPAPAPAGLRGRSSEIDSSRRPVRFLWQTDAADRFLFVSPGLAQLVGRNADVVGESWADAAARLRLDPPGRIARVLQRRDTWSGLTAWWPAAASGVRIPAELTGLPVFGIDQSFQGYRGFGVLKPAEALMPAAFEARFGSAEEAASRPAEQSPPYEEVVLPQPANVVPIRADLDRLPDFARLSAQERSAFEEIAAALRSRIEAPERRMSRPSEPAAAAVRGGAAEFAAGRAADGPASGSAVQIDAPSPTGDALAVAAGGDVLRLFPDKAESAQPDASPGPAGDAVPAAAAPASATGDGCSPAAGARSAGAASGPPEPRPGGLPLHGDPEARIAELAAILETAADGVLLIDAAGRIEGLDAGAEALFGLDRAEAAGLPFADLLAPQSRQAAQDCFDALRHDATGGRPERTLEVEGRVGQATLPLIVTMGRISADHGGRFCAVLHDISQWKRAEADLVAARRSAEHASRQKSDFLARVSHEIRTPLNAIIGFAEVMIEERFGPVENDRYREYLRDIRTSGEHVVSLVNDLLDISKIEAGKLDLNFQPVLLNELVRECITLMQPQANRAHVILRCSLSSDVPAIVADARTLRQIVLNLLSNSVKFTGPGGQVIASTSLAESGEAILRVRDTGPGMSPDELERALEPFRQLATATIGDRAGTGLGLPLTKALVEANRATFSIKSARGEGTVVRIGFPPTRVLSE